MKIIYILLIFQLGLLTCCQEQNDNNSRVKYLDESIKVDQNNIPKNSNQFYFPLELFRDTSIYYYYVGRATSAVKWYSRNLYAMREPLLFNKSSDKEIYRFTWLRTFHNPIAIRIERNRGNYHVYWKVCNGQSGYYPGALTLTKEKLIDKNEWDKFQKLLNSTDYWDLPTNEKKEPGCDGSQWILEGVIPDKYHVVNMWKPNKKSNYYQVCNFLILLTDIEVVHKY